MSPSRSYRVAGLLLIAGAAIVSGTSSGSASISPDRDVTQTVAPQRCSGAFRYAARDGNADIFVVPDAQLYAEDRKLARALRRMRSSDAAGNGAALLVTSPAVMCS